MIFRFYLQVKEPDDLDTTEKNVFIYINQMKSYNITSLDLSSNTVVILL